MNETKLNIGDKVLWRGSCGKDLPQIVTIKHIQNGLERYDQNKWVNSIPFDQNAEDRKFSVTFKEVDSGAWNTQLQIPTKNDFKCNAMIPELQKSLLNKVLNKKGLLSMKSDELIIKFLDTCKTWTN